MLWHALKVCNCVLILASLHTSPCFTEALASAPVHVAHAVGTSSRKHRVMRATDGCFAGWALFGDFVATLYSVSGLILSFIGSGWYSYIKLTEKRAPEPAADTVETAAPAKPKAVPQVPVPAVSIDQPTAARKDTL